MDLRYANGDKWETIRDYNISAIFYKEGVSFGLLMVKH